jgi:hypothetical protein
MANKFLKLSALQGADFIKKIMLKENNLTTAGIL